MKNATQTKTLNNPVEKKESSEFYLPTASDGIANITSQTIGNSIPRKKYPNDDHLVNPYPNKNRDEARKHKPLS